MVNVHSSLVAKCKYDKTHFAAHTYIQMPGKYIEFESLTNLESSSSMSIASD